MTAGAVIPPATVLAAFLLSALVVAVSRPDRLDSLTVILGVAAVGAGVLAVGERGGRLGVSASFIVTVLAAAFLGPASAVGVAVIAELFAALMTKTSWRTVVYNNLAPAVVAGLVSAVLIRSLASPNDDAGFYLTVALAGLVDMVISFVMFASLRRLVLPSAEQFSLGTLVAFLPSTALSILVTVAGVSIALKVGTGGIAFALAAVFAFSYMAHLLDQSRERAKQYVSLSWGVLAGLMRSLDIRDQRAARHSAAVARFARDIAIQVGMSAEQAELAHTAGLLHDIGRFALSDRVAERGRTLTEDDWMAIQRHPELGADMLRDLGMYGPVAEIVLAHHERIDGRGYPQGLGRRRSPRSPRSSPSPRSTTRSPPRTPIARR